MDFLLKSWSKLLSFWSNWNLPTLWPRCCFFYCKFGCVVAPTIPLSGFLHDMVTMVSFSISVLLPFSLVIWSSLRLQWFLIWTTQFSCPPSLAAQSAQASKSQGKQLYLETFQFNITVSLDKFRQKPFPHTSDTLATLGLMFVCCQSV